MLGFGIAPTLSWLPRFDPHFDSKLSPFSCNFRSELPGPFEHRYATSYLPSLQKFTAPNGPLDGLSWTGVNYQGATVR